MSSDSYLRALILKSAREYPITRKEVQWARQVLLGEKSVFSATDYLPGEGYKTTESALEYGRRLHAEIERQMREGKENT